MESLNIIPIPLDCNPNDIIVNVDFPDNDNGDMVLYLLWQEKDTTPGDNPARFQRTDQWIPVYEWLEILDKDEVVKSKDISDWLTENPTVREQLCSRHSRYHLMHYIKKCHLKILKRREKKKVPVISSHHSHQYILENLLHM